MKKKVAPSLSLLDESAFEEKPIQEGDRVLDDQILIPGTVDIIIGQGKKKLAIIAYPCHDITEWAKGCFTYRGMNVVLDLDKQIYISFIYEKRQPAIIDKAAIALPKWEGRQSQLKVIRLYNKLVRANG